MTYYFKQETGCGDNLLINTIIMWIKINIPVKNVYVCINLCVYK